MRLLYNTNRNAYNSMRKWGIDMAEQALVQARIDKAVRDEVAEIFAAQGLDIPTAIRMMLYRSKIMKGLPFEVTLPDNMVTRTEAKNAFEELRRQASDVPEMTLDEINAEISAVRAERKV